MDDERRSDETYLGILRGALAVCKTYRPQFGGGNKAGYTLEEFRRLYGDDPFYHWMGLDSPLLYAAHKAAGGITSVYRQLGSGCERMFRRILEDRLGLSTEQAKWVYQVPAARRGKRRTLSLDARIDLADVQNGEARQRVKSWLSASAASVLVKRSAADQLGGAVFEVRQGYKSKDAKRQNADIANAANAFANRYLPVMMLLSQQIDGDVADRYVRAQWLLLRGTLSGTSQESTYAFCREVIGYDLAKFFERNSQSLRQEIESTLSELLAS